MKPLLLLLLSASPAFAGPCDFDASKRVLAKTADGYTAEWSLPDTAALRAPAVPAGDRYAGYAAWVRAHTKLDARAILENHVHVVRTGIENLGPEDPFRKEMEAEIVGVRKVIDGHVGTIRPMSCLESIAFLEFQKVADLRKAPKELSALLFRKGGALRLVGDFYSDGENGGARERPASTKEARRLTAAGWELYAHLHNHPFAFTNPYGDIGGTTMPSSPDLDAYATRRPVLALITNGIESIELRQDECAELNKRR
jgi:hypothetical protein